MQDNVILSIRNDYDRLAEEYARRIFDELQGKPLDRELLNRFAADVNGRGDAGTTIFGLDLSPGMLKQARKLNPGLIFREGNMMALNLPDGILAGIVAFYSIANIPNEFLPVVFGEMQRVLQPGGSLLLAFHMGDGTTHEQELWGHPLAMDFFFFQPAEIQRLLEGAGFSVEEIVERDPYSPDVEHQSRRAYIFARKPVAG